MVCIRCQKRPAIIFVQRMENGQMKNEGYCLHCAREMHIKPVDDLMKQFGMSDEDMDAMEDRMENMMQEMGDMSNMNPFSMMMGMGQPDQSEEDGDLVPGSSATFPLGVNGGAQNGKNEKKAGKNEKKPPRRKFLDTYCENLTRKAREGKLDDIIGRDREIYRTIQILSRRQKNNPCLIGEAGVGKTAIAEGIAERIAKGQVPAGLQDKEIFLLDLTSLVAGTQFRGQFEQRVKGLLSEVKAAGNVILFIDEIHTITSAGESEGAMNAGNILKPALSRGEIQVIGATTFNEYRKYIEKDQALERRFQPVRVEEPSVADTLAVMGGIKHYYEEHHHVQVPADVLNATVTLSERYITDRYLPDKAIDLLDEACACCNLAHPVISEYLTMQKELEALKQEEADMENADVNEPIDYERVAERKTRMAQLERELPAKQAAAGEIQVTMDDVAKVIELWTGIPAVKIRETEYAKLASLETELKKKIIGQDDAVHLVAQAVKRTLQVLVLSLVFVFLCLAALYESWSVPFAVLLTVPTGIFGAVASEYGLSILEAMFGHQNAGLQDSVYMQIGIIAIIGLAAKNAILIVEFAKVRVDRGMEPVKAAIEAAGLRLRPILMTSFAFIIGCIPLAIATGAGAAARNGMGVAVVGGMLFATALGIFLIPVFFVGMEWIAAKLGLLKQERKKSSADYM